MTDDLVQRLRRTYRKEYAPTGSICGDNSNKPFPFPILAAEVLFNPDGAAAADRIEALEAEIERLRRDHAAAVKEANIAKARLKGVQKQWYADRAALEQSK